MSRTLDHYICECGYNFQHLGSLTYEESYLCPKCSQPMIVYVCDGWDSDSCSCPVAKNTKEKQSFRGGLQEEGLKISPALDDLLTIQALSKALCVEPTPSDTPLIVEPIVGPGSVIHSMNFNMGLSFLNMHIRDLRDNIKKCEQHNKWLKKIYLSYKLKGLLRRRNKMEKEALKYNFIFNDIAFDEELACHYKKEPNFNDRYCCNKIEEK